MKQILKYIAAFLYTLLVRVRYYGPPNVTAVAGGYSQSVYRDIPAYWSPVYWLAMAIIFAGYILMNGAMGLVRYWREAPQFFAPAKEIVNVHPDRRILMKHWGFWSRLWHTWFGFNKHQLFR
jgi:hypothetical protein